MAKLLGSHGWNSFAACPSNPVTWLIVNHVGGKAWLKLKGGNSWFWGQLNSILHSLWPDWILKRQENTCFLWELDNRAQSGPSHFSDKEAEAPRGEITTEAGWGCSCPSWEKTSPCSVCCWIPCRARCPVVPQTILVDFINSFFLPHSYSGCAEKPPDCDAIW